MTDQTAPDADELRVRHHLRRPLDRSEHPPVPPGPPPPVGADELRARSYLYRMGVVL